MKGNPPGDVNKEGASGNMPGMPKARKKTGVVYEVGDPRRLTPIQEKNFIRLLVKAAPLIVRAKRRRMKGRKALVWA